MKKIFFQLKHKMLTCISVLVLTPFLLFSQPATEAQILASIDAGISWLVTQQNTNGSWGTVEEVAETGFVLTKLCDYAYEHGYSSPFDPNYQYSANVISGFDYMFSQARQDYGAVNGIYMYELTENNHHENYNAAISLMALASTYTPTRVITSTNTLVNGLTYAQLVDQIVVYFDYAQKNSGNGLGGWYYNAVPGSVSDNSQAGWSALALAFAEGFGAIIPPNVKTDLSIWADYIQNDVSGGSGYSAPTNWVNSLKTGNLLAQFHLVGDVVGATRVQNALAYLSAHYNDPYNSTSSTGWHGYNQSMFCMMKGFEALEIESIDVGGVMHNWFEDFSTELVGSQEVAGSWPQGPWGQGKIPATFWALYVLEKIEPTPPEPPPVPLSDYAVIVSILLVGAFIVVRYQRAKRFA